MDHEVKDIILRLGGVRGWATERSVHCFANP